ncbi:unnamed protein product [Moneuplotes crassus]|uniref:Uncharacterized protein n=1 Tax=Euplotes crassus TaxID=5936 RepID=A0AAD1XYI1_EUPCR|nr:unnamed protein product [Moneuplotes crassus]
MSLIFKKGGGWVERDEGVGTGFWQIPEGERSWGLKFVSRKMELILSPSSISENGIPSLSWTLVLMLSIVSFCLVSRVIVCSSLGNSSVGDDLENSGL